MSYPTLGEFSVFHVGLSGGKDSTALYLWCLFLSGLPRKRFRFTFCDTGNEDPMTYAFVELLRSFAPIHVLRPKRDFFELAHHKKRFPSTKARFCTQFLKIIPTREDVLALIRQNEQVVRFSGVRRAEGHNTNDRGEAQPWEWIDSDLVWAHRPILDLSLDEVWDIHKQFLRLDDVVAIVENDPTMSVERKGMLIERIVTKGVPCNPLYPMGARRVGCFPCINSSKPEIRAMAAYRPERIDEIREKEIYVGERNFGISTFFPRGYIPLHLNDKEVVIKGKTWDVPTIDAVVLWSQTARGGKQMDIYWDDYDMPPASVCDIGGMCE